MVIVVRGGEPCFGTRWSQRTLSNNKENDMGFNQILTIVGLLISIVAVFFAELAAYSGLLLVIFGLVNGFVSPIADLTGRMAYTVAAVAMLGQLQTVRHQLLQKKSFQIQTLPSLQHRFYLLLCKLVI